MPRFRTLVGLGLASTMMMSAPVFASAPATTAKPATHVATKPATKSKVAAPARTATAAPRSSGRLVKAKLSNGKTVTYDCSLAGNKTKQACRG